MNILRKQKGFTLIEMLIVLFVIGALLLIIIPSLTDVGADAQEKACDANMKTIAMQSEAYYLENNQFTGDITDLRFSETPECPLHSETGEHNQSYDLTPGANMQSITIECNYHDHSIALDAS